MVGHSLEYCSIECGSIEQYSRELRATKIVYVWYVVLPIPHLYRIRYYPNG